MRLGVCESAASTFYGSRCAQVVNHTFDNLLFWCCVQHNPSGHLTEQWPDERYQGKMAF